jgi:hypothetical protein
MAAPKASRLERRLRPLELVALPSMEESVVDFFRRRPSGPRSKPRWTPAMYPKGSEKELYAEFAYIVLSAPQATIPALLRMCERTSATQLANALTPGVWRAYRLSTVRLDRGVRWSGPMCFPGAAGHGGIADVGLFLNPSYDGAQRRQLGADLIIYFEIKSSDHHSHKVSQLQAHLEALDEETPAGVGFLAAVGGRPVRVQHRRWLGHVSLDGFLQGMSQVAGAELSDARLASEVDELRRRKNG